MPLSIAYFQNEITSLGNIYRAMGYANYKSELNLVATAAKHGFRRPTTRRSKPRQASSTHRFGAIRPYIDRIDLLVNKGKAERAHACCDGGGDHGRRGSTAAMTAIRGPLTPPLARQGPQGLVKAPQGARPAGSERQGEFGTTGHPSATPGRLREKS